MIVYTGKQYGNDFNNGDEALFQDANRPRDDNNFQLRPGVNTRKNDLRTANSGIAAQGTFYGVATRLGGVKIEWSTVNMKNHYSASDISDIDGFTASDGTVYKADSLVKGMDAVIIGEPYVNASGGDILIGKGGVYAVTCQCVYVAPLGYNIPDSYNYKFYVAMLLNGKQSQWTQGRGCGGMDAHSVFYVGWFDAGDRVNVGFYFTYPYIYKGTTSNLPYSGSKGDVRLRTSDNKLFVWNGGSWVDYPAESSFSSMKFLCHPGINLYRLS